MMPTPRSEHLKITTYLRCIYNFIRQKNKITGKHPFLQNSAVKLKHAREEKQMHVQCLFRPVPRYSPKSQAS